MTIENKPLTSVEIVQNEIELQSRLNREEETRETEDNKRIRYTDIVNDFDSGGTDVPGSAENDKQLRNLISQLSVSNRDRGAVWNALTPQEETWGIKFETVPNIAIPGTNYQANEAVFIKGKDPGDIQAILVIKTVDSQGSVEEIEVQHYGDYLRDPGAVTSMIEPLGGSGSGLILDVETALEPATIITDIDMNPNDIIFVQHDEVVTPDGVTPLFRSRWGNMDLDGDGTYHLVPLGADNPPMQRDFVTSPITANELASNAVQTAKILNKAVSLSKIGDDLKEYIDTTNRVPACDKETVSTNSQNELQAIGVFEKNNNIVKYDWIGTLQEYYDQQIERLHPEWMCYITNDVVTPEGIVLFKDIIGHPEDNENLSESLDAKQNKLTQELTTVSKTIVGAINELDLNKVSKETKINNRALSTDVTLTQSDIAQDITVLETEGAIILQDNSVSAVTPTGDITFVLPTVTDISKFHQILVQLSMETVITIDVGTSYFFDKSAIDLSIAGGYNIIYEYDGSHWVCGVISKGAQD